MKINYKNLFINIDWKSIVGVCSSIGGFIILNKLSKRGQLDSLIIDLHNQKLSLNA